jgi:hypothetical protein
MLSATFSASVMRPAIWFAQRSRPVNSFLCSGATFAAEL